MNKLSDEDGNCKVECHDDNIAVWYITQKKELFPAGGTFRNELDRIGAMNVVMCLEFFDDYPFRPPFVRLISPSLKGGFIHESGALCMEVLTSSGWVPSMTAANLLEVIRFHMCEGGDDYGIVAVEATPTSPKNPAPDCALIHEVNYMCIDETSVSSRKRALVAFNQMVNSHGWNTDSITPRVTGRNQTKRRKI
jgi:ubiquitin-protein ligase